MAVASKKERRARILGILTLGAITALAVTYVIAPRFSDPASKIQSAAAEVDKKILINERIALLKSQESTVQKVIDDLAATNIALPEPSATADSALKTEIEEMLREVGLSSNSLVAFDTPQQSSAWTAVTNPTLVYDSKKAVAPSTNGEAAAVTMFQKPLFFAVQGPTDRLVQVVRRLGLLDRAMVVDSFTIEEGREFESPQLNIDARIFLMPSVDSPLLDDIDDGTIDEVDTLPNAPSADG